jgi:PAS domain S-box-containing protein
MVEIFEADSVDHFLSVPVVRVYRTPEERTRLSQKLMERGFVRNEEVEMTTLKGRPFIGSVTATIKRQDDGQVLFYGTLQDVTEEKRMERAILEEQEQLRKIAAHIGAGLCLLDRGLKIIWVNEVMAGWFGGGTDLSGSDCYASFHHRAEACEACPSRRALETGLTQSMEKRDILSDGRVLDFSVTSVPIRNARGEVDQVLELVLDVTERRRMFEMLEYERALSKNVFDSISDPLMVVDIQGHVILDINRAFTALTGLTRLETVGRPCETMESRLYSTCRSPEFLDAEATGQSREFMTVYTRPSGLQTHLDVSLIPMRDDKGQIVGVIHIGRDVTERKRLEAELKLYSEGLEELVRERTRAFQKSELMFRRLFESAQDGILILDIEGGTILDVNPYMLQLLETTRDALQGHAYADVIPRFVKEGVLDGLLDELKEKISVFRDDLVLRSVLGREIPVELRLSWYFVDKARVIQVHVRDITERKKIEKIKTEFVSMVSHELRTPLSAIKEGVEIVSDGTQGRLNRSQKECLEIALSNIRRLNRLIGDILDISKIQSNLLTVVGVPCDVAEVIDQVYALVRIEFEKRELVLVTDLKKPLPRVLADRDRLIQVLMNLLNNAAKFTRDKSRVTVAASLLGKNIVFEIRDEGPGIPENELERLFGRFVQLDSTLVRRVGGTGLGLYICKNLMEAMGGRIWAESRPGEGSIFKFELPAVEETL